MKKWSVTSVLTPATCNRRGGGAQPSTEQGHFLLYVQVAMCTHSPLQHKGGKPGTQPTLCSNGKEPAEQERAATGLTGPVSHALPLFLLLSGADRDFI